jgi:two-component system, OmpR family, response regulator ResD
VLRRSKNENAGPTRVLVVNDDPDACELIARIIESAGWIALRCHSHDDALAALPGAKPALKAVLADFHAGGASAGLKLLDDIRRMPAFTNMPVLLLTHNDANRLFAWQAGIDGFLVRPFHADQLINEVYAVLTRTPQERDTYRQQRLSAG